MTDIALLWNEATQTADWSVLDGEIETGDELLTSVLVSLFTDKVLPADQVPVDGSDDPRGWWGDTYTGDPIGSLLWTLSRAVKTSQTALLATAQQMCLDALNWMITDNVATAIQVNTFWITANQMGITVVIVEPSGKKHTFKLSKTIKGAS
ncbi:MAG TPA: phage GP46 family protein [Rhodopila sp.]|jgi:phage gp46-like protein|nr:phage GP46 family protein [Rhodopila sp.]